jgi:hypothetical protein
MKPIAEIVGGILRWHIPHAAYAVPARYMSGSHMLYAATALEAKDAEIAKLRTANEQLYGLGKSMYAELCALKAQVSTLTGSLYDREASLVRMRDMLNQAQAAHLVETAKNSVPLYDHPALDALQQLIEAGEMQTALERIAELEAALRMLRNHTNVTLNQVLMIAEVLAGKPEPAACKGELSLTAPPHMTPYPGD